MPSRIKSPSPLGRDLGWGYIKVFKCVCPGLAKDCVLFLCKIRTLHSIIEMIYFDSYLIYNHMLKTLFKILITALLLNSGASQAQNEFITLWNLSISGSSATQLVFYTSSGPINYSWETYPTATLSGSGSLSSDYVTITGLPANATIKLKIAPNNLQWFSVQYSIDQSRLIDILHWGTTAWTSMGGAFAGCNNLQISATDVPNLTGVTSMRDMFNGCSTLNSPTNIGNWNTANVIDMSAMFWDASAFNQSIGGWNTAKVVDMSSMFRFASVFNQNIGGWNTAKVTNMNFMFYGASKFNQNVGGWNTSIVTNMGNMFAVASEFNQNIGGWNTQNVTDMSGMFVGPSSFNQNIGSWNTSNVTNTGSMFLNASSFNQNIGAWNTINVVNMLAMFQGASAFNQNIGAWNTSRAVVMASMFADATIFNQSIAGWNTSNVVDMSGMFRSAAAFNQNIGGWNTSNVIQMSGMFIGANAFNQNISGWNTAKVVDMNNMFFGAIAFNQNIAGWNISNVTNMAGMFAASLAFNQTLAAWGTKLNASVDLNYFLNGSGMSVANYDATLNGFSAGTVTSRNMGAIYLKYSCAALTARSNLTNTKGWTITGDSLSSPSFSFGSTTTICSGTIAPVLPTISTNSITGTWSPSVVSNTISGIYTFTGACNSTLFYVTINNNKPTLIATQPINQSVCGGALATFAVSATGNNLIYAWNTGETTSTISKSITGTYLATVTGSCGSAISNPVSLTVNPITSIATQPVSKTACIGSNATFAVSATGTGVLSYAWSNSLSATNTMITSIAGSNYRVTVSGACGSAISNPTTLTINALTDISTQPISQTSCPRLNAPFTVSATGTNLAYEWSNGASTTNSMRTSVPGIYVVTVSGTCGSVVSTPTTLTSNAITAIVTQPISQTSCAGLNASFVVSATGTGALTYTWSNGLSTTNTMITSTPGTYLVTVSGTCDAAVSSPVSLVANNCTPISTVTVTGLSASRSLASINTAILVSLTGYGFQRGATVTIGGVVLTNVSVVGNVLTGTIPAGSTIINPNSPSVVVQNPNQLPSVAVSLTPSIINATNIQSSSFQDIVLNIYPNPTTGLWSVGTRLEACSYSACSYSACSYSACAYMACSYLEVYNSLGSIVYSQPIISEITQVNAHLVKGIYLVKVGNSSAKLVVE